MSGCADRERAPAAAQVLGFGGLVPFVAGSALAIAATAPGPEFWLQTLVAYAAVIASFVGALHWAHALRSQAQGARAWLQYGWSVVPALLAWIGLLLPTAQALPLLAAVLAGCYAADRGLARLDPLPVWMLRLRGGLTTVAVCALLVAAAFGRRGG